MKTPFFLCVALLAAAPAWAINKCPGADGRVIFQDKPCPGQGETVAEDLARREQARKQMLADAQKQAQEQMAIKQYTPTSQQAGGAGELADSGSGGRSIGVGGYTTRTGHYVAPYQRSAPSARGGRRR